MEIDNPTYPHPYGPGKEIIGLRIRQPCCCLMRLPIKSNLLCYFARRQINRHRDVFEDDQPFTPDLSIAVGNPYRPVDGTALLIRACDVLDTVTESEIAVHRDAKIGNRDFRPAAEMREEVHPVLAIGVGAMIFLPRHDVENDKTVI